jgi:hypothetical protein
MLWDVWAPASCHSPGVLPHTDLVGRGLRCSPRPTVQQVWIGKAETDRPGDITWLAHGQTAPPSGGSSQSLRKARTCPAARFPSASPVSISLCNASITLLVGICLRASGDKPGWEQGGPRTGPECTDVLEDRKRRPDAAPGPDRRPSVNRRIEAVVIIAFRSPFGRPSSQAMVRRLFGRQDKASALSVPTGRNRAECR